MQITGIPQPFSRAACGKALTGRPRPRGLQANENRITLAPPNASRPEEWTVPAGDEVEGWSAAAHK